MENKYTIDDMIDICRKFRDGLLYDTEYVDTDIFNDIIIQLRKLL